MMVIFFTHIPGKILVHNDIIIFVEHVLMSDA